MCIRDSPNVVTYEKTLGTGEGEEEGDVGRLVATQLAGPPLDLCLAFTQKVKNERNDRGCEAAVQADAIHECPMHPGTTIRGDGGGNSFTVLSLKVRAL